MAFTPGLLSALAEEQRKRQQPQTMPQQQEQTQSGGAVIPEGWRLYDPDNAADFYKVEDNRSSLQKVGNAVQDFGAGVLKIAPTAIKGVADLANMLTGDTVDWGVSKGLQRGMDAIDDVVGSEHLAKQKRAFGQMMQDENVGIGDILKFAADNKSMVGNELAATVGSMFLPAGAAGLAAKGAKAAKLAKGLSEQAAKMAAKKAAERASLATVAGQNAAETFSETQGDLSDRYLAAGVSGVISALAGKALGGGAEGMIARRLAGDTSRGLTSLAGNVAKEAGQESLEELGGILGEWAGTGEAPNATNAGKQMAYAGLLGGLMGGGAHIGQHGIRPVVGEDAPQIDPNAGPISRAAAIAQQQSGQSPLALPAPGQLSGEAAMQMPDNSHDDGGNPVGVIEAMRRNMQLQQAREQAAREREQWFAQHDAQQEAARTQAAQQQAQAAQDALGAQIDGVEQMQAAQQAEDALARAFDSQAQHDAQRARFAPPEYERLDAQNGWEQGTAQRMHEYRNELAARGEENLTEAEAGVLAGLNEMFGTQAQPQAMQHAADTMPQQAALDARSAQHGEEAAAAQSTAQAADVASRETANDAPQAGLSGAGATQDALTAAQVAGQDAQNVGQITAPAAPTADLSEDARGTVEGGGAATRIITPDGKKLAAQWDVVEADEVQATLKEGVNQPRDRTRAASDAQVRAIAQNPDFDRLSDTSQTMDYGAPTLTREGVIVAGNGRFEGVSGAYAGAPQAAAQYRAQLEENAQRFGLDAQRIRGMKKPVLVRRVTQDADTRQLAVQSNQPAGLRMSDMEQAALDAERMGANLADLHIHEDGSIAPTQHNHEVIARALGGYTTEEAGEFMAADGGLSQAGLRRVRNAILYRAYGKSDVLTRLLEAPDADMRNVGTALLRAVGSLAENRRAMDENHIPAEYDIAADLEAAIAALSRIRASGQHVESFLAQSDWVGGGLSESGRTILRMVSENLRSAKAITQFLREYAARVQSLQNTSGGLFGDMPRPGKQEVLEDVKRRFDEQRNLARGQNDLFGQPADSARGDGGTATADGQDAKPAGVAGDARGAGSGAQAGADGRGVSGQPQAGQDEGTDGGAVVAENATAEDTAKTEEQAAKTEEQTAPSDWVGLTFAQAAEDWDGRSEAQRVKVLAAALRKNEMDLRSRMKTGRKSFAELDPALQRRVAAAMTLLRDKSERNGATVKQLMAQRAGKDLPQTPERNKTGADSRYTKSAEDISPAGEASPRNGAGNVSFENDSRDAETGTSGGVIPGNGQNVEQGAAQGANLNQAEAVRKGNGQNLNQEAGEDARTPKERHAEEVASGRTVLDFHAWQKARSPQFKEWFGGDWETLHDLTVPEAATEEYAREQLKKIAGQDLRNDETGFVGRINRKQADKILSPLARDKSIANLKYEMDAAEAVARHYAMAARMAELWKHAVYVGEFKDKNEKDKNGKKTGTQGVRIHRFAVAVRQGGKVRLATILAKEDAANTKGQPRVYTLELHEEKALQETMESWSEDSEPASLSRSAEEILRATEEKINPPFLNQTNPTTGEPWGEIVKFGGQGERELAMPYAHRPLLQPEGRHEWQEYVREMRMALGEYKPIGGESMEEMFMKGDREARALFDEAYKKLAESGRVVPPGVRDRKLFNLAAELHHSNKAEQDALFAQVMAASQARQDRSKAAKFWDDALPQEREDMLTAALPNGSPRFKEFLAMPWEQVRAQLSPVSLVKGWRAMKAPQAAASTQRQGRTQKGIGNFGERISDNSKRVRLINYGSLTDIAERALSDIWPLDSVREIEDTFLAAVAHAARAAIPAKPKNEYKVGVWAEHVRDALRMAKDAARLELDVDGFRQYAEHGKFYFMDNVADKVELLTNIDRAFWGGVEEVRLFKGETGIDARVRLSGSRERQSIQGKDIADIASQVSDRLAAHLAKEKPRGKRDVSFEVVRARGKTIIQARGSYAALKEFEGATQEVEREAQAYIDAHHDELLAEWERFNTRDGRDVREGKDVTPDAFSAAFGFRGVEFGRATGQKERQTLLNRAFDALHDLADLLGVPTQALSLNGSLGLAFGSRGRGNANAHFEPDSLVINLTRERGAGTLAHEWFHALDNYFSRMRGVRYGSMTKMKEGDAAGNVRAEMVKAFNKLVMALNASPMAKRSRELDDSLGTRRYFTRPEERAARAFENYVIAKMQAQGIRNNYLAYVLPEYRSREGQYPYLLAEEAAPIEKAFDNLFAKVKTKQTDKGVALFARAWHGSPHGGIEKGGFKMSAVGSGEGNQTYGWGIYFAEAKEGGMFYRENIFKEGGHQGKDGNPGQLYQVDLPEKSELLNWFKPFDEQPEKIRKALKGIVEEWREYTLNNKNSFIIHKDKRGKRAMSVAHGGGKYWRVVDHTKYGNGATFASWHGNFVFVAHDEHTKNVLRKTYPDMPIFVDEHTETAEQAIALVKKEYVKQPTGDQLYAFLVKKHGSPRAASEALLKKGIPGLCYLDGVSRDNGVGEDEGTHNYVIWDESLLTPEAANIRALFARRQLLAQATMQREAYTLEDARSIARREFVGHKLTNAATGQKATLSASNLRKMTSEKAHKKSANARAHAMAVANADALFEAALLDHSHEDKNGEPTIAAIHRFVAPMVFDGRVFAVKMTVKETTSEKNPNPIYSIEAIDVENPPSVLSRAEPDATGIRPQAGFSEKVLERLAEVKRALSDPASRRTDFAREEAAGAPSRGRFALAAGGVRRVVREALQGVGNAPRVEVVETVADLPFAAPSDAQGAFHNGRVWLVAENLKSAQEAREVLAHEMIGHYGLRGFFGRGLDMVLNRIHANNARVRQMALQWRRDNADLIRTLEARGVSREAIRARSIEEALAQMAQAGEKLTGWKMLAGFVQNLLRKIGAHRWANMLEARTDAEALTALKQAEMFVRDGLTANDTIPNGALAAFEKAAQADAGAAFSFAGERGAQSLDAAEEVTHRMDNLAVAREMEAAGRDAKTVKLATGWERGKDGKWRYELDDGGAVWRAGADALAREEDADYGRNVDRLKELELRGMFKTLNDAERAEYARLKDALREQMTHWSNLLTKGWAYLEHVLEAPELFRAYPQLRNIGVKFGNIGDAKAQLRGEQITLSRELLYRQDKVLPHLLHEIQHAIQSIEGFAQGGNIELGRTLLERERREEREALIEKIRSYQDAADKTSDPAKRKRYLSLIETWKEGLKVPEREAFMAYHRLAGETEARNTEARRNMTAEQRRATLAEETEDVAREDQIVLQEMLGEVQESRSAQKSVTANIARGQAAMNRALLEKADQHRAMFRTGLGWVDFVWGDARKGVAHIIEERQAKDGITREETARMLMEKVVPAIARGEETRRFEKDGAVRVYIEHEGVRASLVRQPGSNAWLLTAFELNTPHPAGRGATPAADTAAAPTRTRRNGGGVSPAGNGAGTASIAQRDGDSQSPSNTKGNAQSFARWKREKDAGRTDLNYPAWLDAQKQDGSQDDAPLFARGGSAAAAAPSGGVPPSGNNGAPSQQAVNAFGNITAEQEAALRATGLLRSPKTLRQRFAELTDNLGKRLVQGLVDQYAPLKELDFRAYVLARMSKGTDGAFEALLHYGTPKVRGDTLEVDTSTGGLMQVLSELDGEQDRFLAWIAANRAEKLSQEGREFLFTPEQIQHLKALNQGTMKDGTSRAMRYAATLRKFNDFQDAVLAIAEARGLIDAESRAVWQNGFYVPFYRNMEDGTTGASVRSGLVNQYAFKKLKGSRRQLNEDLLANTLQNMAHLLSAAAKNQAASAALRAADSAGVAHRVPSGTKGSVRFLDNGREVHYLVDDPFVFDAITSLESVKVAGLEKVLSKFKHMLTFGVTINPTFQLRSLIRDALQSMAITNIGMNPLANVKQGIASQLNKDQDYINALASGGLIRFNSLLEGNRADYTRRLIRKGVKDSTILDTPEKIRNFFETAVDKWLAVGDISESTNRMALYKQLVAQGVDPLLAAYQARDLMDFSMQGQWRAVRFLTQVVPFLNARMQGLYKLGRDGVMPTARVLFGQGSATDKQIARRFGAVTGAVALASIALMAAYEDDDDWKRREDWDRDTYWWFKLGGTAYRIPKPFEVGAIGTVAERTAELLMSDEMTGRRFLSRMGHMASDTFSLNPIPQAVKPLLDVYANKDSFTGRPIESMGMERLRPEDRYTGSTSELAKWLGQLGLPDPARLVSGEYSALSPVQIDALIRGYFSWIGVSASRMVDEGVRAVAERPARPAMQLRDVFFAGNFVESLPSNTSRYVTALYEQAKEVETAYASYRFALRQGDLTRARELLARDGDKIRMKPQVTKAKSLVAKLSENIRAVERDPHLSAAEKRLRIDRIKSLQHQAAMRAARL